MNQTDLCEGDQGISLLMEHKPRAIINGEPCFLDEINSHRNKNKQKEKQ